MKKGCLITSVIALAAFAVGIALIYRIFFIPSGIEIDKKKYPITGIDVSKHSGKIDFKKVQSESIDFIIIKATEGENYVDEMFEKNYIGAKQNAIPIGVYHFFRFNKSGKNQAENFLSKIKGKRFDLPFVLDIEEWGNITTETTNEVIFQINEFIILVKKVSGERIMIYTNESSYNKYVKENFDKNDIWICSFSKKPTISKQWTLWQHSHKGKFDFAPGWIDINTFNGNRDEWNRYLRR